MKFLQKCMNIANEIQNSYILTCLKKRGKRVQTIPFQIHRIMFKYVFNLIHVQISWPLCHVDVKIISSPSHLDFQPKNMADKPRNVKESKNRI